MSITLHFSASNLICHFIAQLLNVVKSFWSSAIYLVCEYPELFSFDANFVTLLFIPSFS